jgi:iron complex outermembrane receptor protein
MASSRNDLNRATAAARPLDFLSAVLLAVAAPCIALGQTAAGAASPAASPANDNTVLEEVLITGSSIRGVAPTGSALLSMSRESIEAAAPANTKEMLATMPQLGNFGANAEQSTPNRFRTAGFQPNIHNLGIYATLTLFNGHRVAPVGSEAVFPDPSIIPVIAVDRVELIADGASSIYGSDAVAGVVNFIYRKNLDGLEVSGTYGFNNTSYRKHDFAAAYGRHWGGGNMMLAYEYSDNTSPLTTEIPFLALGGDQTSRGGRDLRGSVCLTPTVRSVDAAGRPTGTTYGYPSWTTTAVDQRCGVLAPSEIIPDGKRHAFLLTAEQQLSDRVKAWTEVNYSIYKTHQIAGRQTLNLVVPRTNPYFTAPPALANASQIYVTRSALGLFDPINNYKRSEVTAVTLGADIQLSTDWVGNLMFHASTTRDFNNDHELDLQNAQAAANGTTTATALNPFGQAAQNNAAVLARIDNGFDQNNIASQRLRELQFKADGPLFAIAGGEVRSALGVDLRNDEAKQLQTAGSTQSTSSFYQIVRNDDVKRTVLAGFFELNVPLVSDKNARPGVRSLTLSVAGRDDYYENYGAKFNPKYGFVWAPIDSLKVRGSYGTSFAAPNAGLLTSIFGVPQPNSNYNLTVAAGPTAGERLATINVYNLGGGNPALQPEEAKTWSAGLDWAPTAFLDGLRVGVTYYNVLYSNLIYKPTNADVITDPAFIDSRVLHPTAAQIAAAIAFAPPQQPITTSYDLLFNSYAINIGARKLAGMDYDIAYRLRTASLGTFNFSLVANQQLKYSQEIVPGRGYTSRLGTSDAPKWKGRLAVTWNIADLSLSAFLNHTGSFQNTTTTPIQEVASWTTLDLTAQYQLPKVLKNGLTLQLRAQNALNRDPPFYDAANGYFPALASPFGRTYEVTVRAKF